MTIVPAGASPGQGTAYVKFAHPASRYAIVGVAAVVVLAGGRCTAAHVAIGGLLPAATRCERVGAALMGQPPSPEVIARAAEQVSDSLGDNVLEDLYASAEYRKSMAVVYVRRALTAAVDRAA